MDPTLKPILRNPTATALRDRNCIQVGIDPNHSLLLTGEVSQIRQFLNQLDGNHEVAELVKNFDFAEVALFQLTKRGLLETDLLDQQITANLTPEQLQDLIISQRSYQAALGRLDFAPIRLQNLARSYIWLPNAGPVAALAAIYLAQAQIGRIKLEAISEFKTADLPFWLRTNQSAETALLNQLQQCSTNLKLTQPAGMPDPDIVILTDQPWQTPEVAINYLNRGIAHLVIQPRISEVVVGPLVIPGLTSCLNCAEQQLLEVDRSWSVMRKLIGQHQHDQPDWLLLNLAVSFAITQLISAIGVGDLTRSELVNQRWRFRLPGPRIEPVNQPINMFCSCQWGLLAA